MKSLLRRFNGPMKSLLRRFNDRPASENRQNASLSLLSGHHSYGMERGKILSQRGMGFLVLNALSCPFHFLCSNYRESCSGTPKCIPLANSDCFMMVFF